MTTEKTEPRPVQLYRENLPPGRILDFPYGALDRLNVPIHTATLLPDGYDVSFDGLSYGTTQDEAKIGAFGELAETAFAKVEVPKLPRTRASYNELVSQHGEGGVLDPIEACLEAGSTYDHDRALDWVEARRYGSGETVLVPVDLVASTPSDLLPEEQKEERLVLPVTNGLGAGPSLAHALSHAILEMVQRDGNSVNYRAVDQGVVMDLDEVSDPEVLALLEGLDRDGVEVIPKLAADDYGMANVYVVGYDRNPEDAAHPIMLSACGEAAHPDREKALRKALLEFIAARAQALPAWAFGARGARRPSGISRPLPREVRRGPGGAGSGGDGQLALPLPRTDDGPASGPRLLRALPRRLLGAPAHPVRGR